MLYDKYPFINIRHTLDQVLKHSGLSLALLASSPLPNSPSLRKFCSFSTSSGPQDIPSITTISIYLPSGKDLRILKSWHIRSGKSLRLSCSTPHILQVNKLKTKEANILALNHLLYGREALVNHRHFNEQIKSASSYKEGSLITGFQLFASPKGPLQIRGSFIYTKLHSFAATLRTLIFPQFPKDQEWRSILDVNNLWPSDLN